MKRAKELLEIATRSFPTVIGSHCFTLAKDGRLQFSINLQLPDRAQNWHTVTFDDADFERPVEDIWKEICEVTGLRFMASDVENAREHR